MATNTATSTKLAQPHHEIVVNLLIEQLSPIGVHRRSLPKAKGKRRRKRKREVEEAANDVDKQEVPVAPSITADLLVGFNAVTSHLEQLSTVAANRSNFASPTTELHDTPPAHIAAVFLLRPMDDFIYNHLPALIDIASLAHPESPNTAFVLLDPSVEPRFKEALGYSSVSLLALLDGMEQRSVIEYVREHAPAMGASWLEQASGPRWLGTTVDVQ